jgi:lipid-A-disaccharide synthase
VRLFISAGEASGENYGAQLIEALRRRAPALDPRQQIDVFGVGGPRMQAAGFDAVVDAREVAVVGIVEVLTHLPGIYRRFHQLVRVIEERRPDAAVLIDFPDFNFRLARELHRRGIPVFYYISPQMWAWRPGRIELVRRYVRRMLVIFPFETDWYRERGVDVTYVGHPLADLPRPAISRHDFAAQHGLEEGKPWIALMPGSRRKEVLLNLPELLRVPGLLGAEYEYILPVAPTLEREWVSGLVATHICEKRADVGHQNTSAEIPVKLVDDARAALIHSRAAAVASGTATVDAALMGTPFVMVYRVAPLTYAVGRPLVKLTRFAMVNLIAGRDVVPELVQRNFTAEKLTAELRRIIPDGEARSAMLAGLAEVQRRLHPASDVTSAERTVDVLLAEIGAVASVGR